MMGAFIPAAIILATGLVNSILSAAADSSAKSDLAESYIAGFFRTTVETAITPHSDEYATNAVKALLLREVPLDQTARFMLGRAWPTDNKPAGIRFQRQFHDFVAETLTRSLRANPSVALEVRGSRARPDGSLLVLSNLNLPSGKAVPIDWQVAQDPADGTFQITDVAVLGIHAAMMLRTIAETMLGDGKTGVEELIPQLRAALNRRAGTDPARPTVTSP
jgi:ABC-type transporter MlaC component